MNIDKQIKKLLDNNFGTECGSDCATCLKLASQIKQSILKAIMERKPEFYDEEPSRAIDEFESVIKQVLQTKTNEKD